MSAFGLLLLDAIIVIPIIASLFAVLISLWAAAIAIGVSAGFLIFTPLLVALPLPYYLILLAAIALIGLAIAFVIGLYYLSKYFVKMVVKYAKAHYRIIVGG